MSKKDRIINDWRFMLHQKWEHSVLEEEPKIQGELKTKFRNLPLISTQNIQLIDGMNLRISHQLLKWMLKIVMT